MNARKSWKERLRDPRWQRKRLEIMEAADFQCEECGDCKQIQHVHHVLYLSGREPWEYPKGLLINLCERCHKERQEIEEAIYLAIALYLRTKTISEMQETPAWVFLRMPEKEGA